jgi:hypothetical protein
MSLRLIGMRKPIAKLHNIGMLLYGMLSGSNHVRANLADSSRERHRILSWDPPDVHLPAATLQQHSHGFGIILQSQCSCILS